ncbi:hypothetical protein CJD36_017130 [Flavipsychrobacter stenotrophus]|uniref:Uncharacterized protein n=1 Tax=Flavipsychrobacter stenotrophus TaxID=2077091 RepID=A0A2S7SSH0_9BACT|nr:hypothetical protein [Flavipsychrobacter stenotrophus]PQJ09658.1 hypothetical protein CJD36_017130 [Flavipsychrobacter stenotrophus]
MSRIFSFILSVLLLAAGHSIAATDTATKKKGMVLVMLHAEKNRLEAARKVNNTELFATIAADAEQVRIRTIMDFTENLESYPVYYIMDSNYEKIYHKQFDGIVLNADGSIATDVKIDTAKPNYILAYYGTGDFQTYFNSPLTESDKEKYQQEGGRTHGMGLTIYNSKFHQLTHFYKMAYANPTVLTLEEAKKLPHNRTKRYFFKSKQLEMEYYPFADELDKSFKKKTRRETTTPY